MKEKELKQILREDFNFEKYWKPIFSMLFNKVEYFSNPSNPFKENGKVKYGQETGFVKLDDNKSLSIFEVEVDDSIRIDQNRKGLRDIAAKHIDQNITHGALVFFHSKYQKDYRFSFIAKWSEIDLETGEFIKGETKPKRFTYLLGDNESCTTAAKRLLELAEKKSNGSAIGIKQLMNAFSVEALNKDFFKTYKEHYEKFWRYIANPDSGFREILLDDSKDNKDKKEKPIRDFAKKLLGRIVFLHFLQKKGWMGCPANMTKWEDGEKQFMQLLFDDFSDREHFHSKCLTKLFFNTLNTKRTNDLFKIEGLKGKLNGSRVPYLNGGLFDTDKPIETLKIDFPENYFSELLDFFEQYNFTIDENSPDDHEVGIDPEMLGHIFENLLEENREKGAFYTPKEVVQYMCKESSIQYLKNHFPEESNIESFIKYNVVSEYFAERDNAMALDQKLNDIKICDPAIGSGAFPIGILHEIFEAKKFIYPYLKTNKEFNPANVKKQIIQNSIYGVDIEKGAVDIAQLRFWLALVVDEEAPHPLPNLDYKIMQGNSLLESFEGIDLSKAALFDEPKVRIIEPDLFREPDSVYGFSDKNRADIKQLVTDYFIEEDKDRKIDIRKQIDKIVTEHIDKSLEGYENQLLIEIAGLESTLNRKKELLQNTSKTEKEIESRKKLLTQKGEARKKLLDFEHTDERPYFLWHLYFMDVFEKGGFDIVIGNPPYQRIQGIRKEDPKFADQLVELYDSATGSFDLYVTFAEKGLMLCKNEGVLNFIMPVKWTNSSFGRGLRKIMSEKKAVNRIISFGAYQVFNASTYTGLQWFKRNSKTLNYAELDRDLINKEALRKYLVSLKTNSYNQINAKDLSEATWVLTSDNVSIILNLIGNQPKILKEIFFKTYQGIATGMDNVFFLKNCSIEKGILTGYSDEKEDWVEIEEQTCKMLLKGDQVHRYQKLSTDIYVVFPYRLKGNKYLLYEKKYFKSNFPLAYAYLKTFESELRNREKGKFDNESWFQFSRKQGMNDVETEKIVAPEISLGCNFSYDPLGEFYSTTKVYGYILNKKYINFYKFYLAVLNSKVLWFFIKNTGYTLRGGYFTFKTNYLTPFPLPDVKEINSYSTFEILCEYVLYLKNSINDNISTKAENEHIAHFFEDIIDGCVFELYFKQHMKEKDINILKMVSSEIKSIAGKDEKEAGEIILNTWLKMRKSEIAERMRSFTVKSPDILKPIIQS